jgi:hypothetical protein
MFSLNSFDIYIFIIILLDMKEETWKIKKN